MIEPDNRKRTVVSRLLILGLLAGLVLMEDRVEAQGGPTTLQFSFSNPGARSLGLGGAFVALADDATAAFANPAGLVQLTRPEVSLEGRYWQYSTPVVVGGRTLGQPTGIGLDGPIRIAESELDTSALSFLSVVYPWKKWTFALSHHRSAKFESFSETQGLFTNRIEDDPQPTCITGTNLCRYDDIRRRTEIDLQTTTASIAYQVGERFSLGVGLSYYAGSFLVISETYQIVEETLPEGFFGPNAYAPEAHLGSQVISVDKSDTKLSLGFLWFLSPQWSLGGVYRAGAHLSGTVALVSGAALDPPIPMGTVQIQEPAMPLDVPDVYGLGVAYRSQGGSWTASFEWDRVQYSQIIESIGRSPVIDVDDIRLDDANELRLGVEYAFLDWSPLMAIRGGVWRDPDHTIRTEEIDPLEQVLLPGGQDEVHFALGLGVAFENIQLDLAVDLSDQVNTAALSLIYQF